jgi:hypothetical protein
MGGSTGTGGSTSGAAGTTGAGGSSAGAGGQGGTSGTAGTKGSGGSAGANGGAGGTAGGTGATGAGGQNVDAGTSTDGKVSSPDAAGGYSGRWVSVEIVDAIIAPGKADGTSWDGTVNIPQSVLNALGTALAGGDPVGGTLAVLAGPDLNNAILSLDKPDAYGWAQATIFGITGDAYWLAQPSEAVQDSYTPIWPERWEYVNVPIDSDVRIMVTLMDSDFLNSDDSIGAAQINSTDLKDALAMQQKTYVRVDDQTDGQLLFIGISVVQQTGPM